MIFFTIPPIFYLLENTNFKVLSGVLFNIDEQRVDSFGRLQDVFIELFIVKQSAGVLSS
jgi:hypothetical protein